MGCGPMQDHTRSEWQSWDPGCFLETKFLTHVHCCVVIVTAGLSDAVTIDLLLYTTLSTPGDTNSPGGIRRVVG